MKALIFLGFFLVATTNTLAQEGSKKGPVKNEGCAIALKEVPYLLGIATDYMVNQERLGKGVIAGTDVGSPSDKALVCLSNKTYRWKKGTTWQSLPAHWGSINSLPESLVTVRIVDRSLRTFFNEVSNQTGLTFRLVKGLEDCTLTALLRDTTVRKLLGLTLQAGKLTYQQLGRADHFTIAPRRNKWAGCSPKDRSQHTKGTCRPTKGSPISLRCRNAPLFAFATAVFDQSEADFFIWDAAQYTPTTVTLSEASLDDAMLVFQQDGSLSVKREKSDKGRSVSVGAR